MAERKTGVQEWAEVSKNFLNGCRNDCKYCYARDRALKRFKIIKSPEEWRDMKVSRKDFSGKKEKGRIMLPTTHDLFPEHYQIIKEYLWNLLAAGNEVLVVSKPRMDVIIPLLRDLEQFRDKLVFRFTIGSLYDDVLNFWEPGAPTFAERVDCLKEAYWNGFKTSVSCEPYLDDSIFSLIDTLLPLVSDKIWVGRMNKIDQRVDTTGWGPRELDYLRKVKEAQALEYVKELYVHYHDNQKVEWKDSIRVMLGLPEIEGVG